jgi:hypothetical protein
MLQHDLDDILSKSRKNNIELGITGMLLYGNMETIHLFKFWREKKEQLIVYYVK